MRIQALGKRQRQERPPQAGGGDSGNRRDAGTDPHNRGQRPRNQRHRQVKGHLHRQTPQVGQTAGEDIGDIDLQQEQVREPGLRIGAESDRKKQQHHTDTHPIRRHNACDTLEVIRLSHRPALPPAVGTPQQKPRQCEKYRHEKVEAAKHTLKQAADILTGLKGDVCHNNAHRRNRA